MPQSMSTVSDDIVQQATPSAVASIDFPLYCLRVDVKGAHRWQRTRLGEMVHATYLGLFHLVLVTVHLHC